MSDQDGCCRDADGPTREHPPGLTELSIAAAQPNILARMVAQLPLQRVDAILGVPLVDAFPLRALTARGTDDASIALLDAWACACDVMGFYGERILSEGFLATAVERRSVAELARAIGYEPSPGVAASARLAFTVDAQAPRGAAVVPERLPVASVPNEGQTPQTFETIESIDARVVWNDVAIAQTKRQWLAGGAKVVWLQGVGLRLAPGDALVLLGGESLSSGSAGDERWDFRFVAEIREDAAGGITEVTLDRDLGDGHTAPSTDAARVVVLRRRASLFGAAAPNPEFMSFPLGVDRNAWVESIDDGDDRTRSEWRKFGLDDDPAAKRWAIDLDREYEGVLNGSWMVLQSGLHVELYRIKHASPRHRRDFGLSMKVTRLAIDRSTALPGENLALFGRRSTTVFIGHDIVALAEAPWTTVVSGYALELDRVIDTLEVGRLVTITGQTSNGTRVVLETRVESCAVAPADDSRVAPRTIVTVAHAITSPLVRSSVRLLGNVARATHGESVEEVLGHGSGAARNQSMTLRQGPLTWVAADNPQGREAALAVRIDGLAWTRVESLYHAGDRDRVFELHGDESGRTTVAFGDGRRGARPPSGVENVRVAYRKGLGVLGEAEADRLTMLMRRPLGMKAVTNPMAATGGADRESTEEIRSNASLRVMSLDRLVSVQDYEDFARAFAGIGKAGAATLWTGKRQLVHLTVATASGASPPAGSAVMTKLSAALLRFADPSHVARIAGFVDRRFAVELRIVRDAAWDKVDVTQRVQAALVGRFGFAARTFGQAVTDAEITAVVQSVPGVIASSIEALHIVGTPRARHVRLTAASARFSGGAVQEAELLLVAPGQITVAWSER